MAHTPEMIAHRGEAIYKEKFQEVYERLLRSKYFGKFLAIDISSEKAFVDDTPLGALQKAQAENPDGLFHLVKIGFPGVYKLGYTSGERGDWIFRR